MTDLEKLGTEFPTLGEAVVVTDLAEIKEILSHPAFVQAGFEGHSAELMRDVLNNLDGARHLARRRILAKLFGRSSLEFHRGRHFDAVLARTLQEVRDGAEPGRPVPADLVALVWRMVHRLAGAIAGIDGLDDPVVADRFIADVQAFGRSLTVEWTRAEDPGELVAEGMAARERIRRAYFEESAARRRKLVRKVRAGEMEASELPGDLITMLLLHEEEDWDAQLPLREACVFLMAATQTTSHAFPRFVILFEEWLDRHPDRRVGLADDLELLRGAVFEALRLFVASPARLRRARTEVTLSTGRVVHADERVALFFRPASMDADVFGEDSDRYDPLRRVVGSVPPWGLAFGFGSHACPGRPLVVGDRQTDYADGTLVSLARALYRSGMQLDPDRAPRYDETTYYDSLAALPVLFASL